MAAGGRTRAAPVPAGSPHVPALKRTGPRINVLRNWKPQATSPTVLLSTPKYENEQPPLSTRADEEGQLNSEDTNSVNGKSEREGIEVQIERDGEKIPSVTCFTIDPAGALTHDETTVDVVTIPCPGGHPTKSWNRDGLMGRFYGAPSMRDAEIRDAERPGPSWVRQGIRREADKARILLYEHPPLVSGTTLNKLAVALLENLWKLRAEEGQERPLLFITHSVGGLVVKMALVKASRDPKYERIMRQCYGIAFFGTPHQGSSYFSRSSLAPSIQTLLHLSAPMPPSLASELRMGNRLLLHIDEDFKTVSDDLHVWTFYETIDSRLSGSPSGDVYFTAPLTSIKSAILGMRQERIFPLQSDHANLASFGRHNVHTLKLFLRQLASQIDRADLNSRDGGEAGYRTLNLEQKVHVEVHGFFREAGEDMADGTIRAWSTRLPLKDFLIKGPEECLSERLNEVDDPPDESRFLANRGRTSVVEMGDSMSPLVAPPISFSPKPMTVKNALGINQHDPSQAHQTSPIPVLSLPVSPVLHPVDARRESAATTSIRPASDSLSPPSRPLSPQTHHSTPQRRPSPIRFDLDQELAINRLSPPLRANAGRPFGRSMSLDNEAEAASPPRLRDFPPFSKRSRSAFDGPFSVEETDDEEGLEASPQLPEPLLPNHKYAKHRNYTSETAVMHETLVAFAKPHVEARKFVWIHLPFNNPTWVSSILQTLQNSYKRDFSALSNHDFWMTRHTRGRHPQHHAYFARPGFYFTAPRTLSPRMRSLARSPKSPTLLPASPDDDNYTCLFIPYLHFDSYKKMLRRRDFIRERLSHRRAHPIPESVTKVESLELQVIWEYLGHDPPINCRRTLDQFGYPSLRDTRSRDDDQMLYKLTKERDYETDGQRGLHGYDSSFRSGPDGSVTGNVSGNQNGSGSGSGGGMGTWRERLSRWDNKDDDESSEGEVLDGNVLMVDQLWLWTISSHTLLTFFPKRESDPIEGPLYQQADLRDSIFSDVNVDLTRQCDNALDLAALAALHAVTVLLDRASHPDLEIFRIFEEAISVLTEKLTSSLKEFRTEGFRDKALVYESVENKAYAIRARFREEGSGAERENRDNTSAMLELRDIEDELQMLLHLFEQQSKVISSMHSTYNRPEMRDQTIHGRLFLSEAQRRLRDYTHQAEDMIRRVRSTRDDFDKLLQMVQRQAQVDEVRLSRLHADLASAQSRSVLIFTTFTVIFLPLQFFTGLFGMNTKEWGGPQFPSLRTIGEISLPSSFLLIFATLMIAWSTTVRSMFRWLGRLYSKAMHWLYMVAGRPIARRLVRVMVLGTVKAKRRQDARAEGSSGGVSRETSDFWERHRVVRERGYKIPEANKAGARNQNRGRESK